MKKVVNKVKKSAPAGSGPDLKKSNALRKVQPVCTWFSSPKMKKVNKVENLNKVKKWKRQLTFSLYLIFTIAVQEMWKSEKGPHPLLRSCQWPDGLALLARIVGRWVFLTQVVISFWFLQLFGIHFLHRKCFQSCGIFCISFFESTYSKRNSKYLLFVGVR